MDEEQERKSGKQPIPCNTTMEIYKKFKGPSEEGS
jgi:hypothetical protein